MEESADHSVHSDEQQRGERTQDTLVAIQNHKKKKKLKIF